MCPLVPGSICATEKSRRAAARVAHEEESQALARTWRNLQRSLSGERGLWMDPDCAEPPHWKLDKFEDPSRRWATKLCLLAFLGFMRIERPHL